MIRGEVRAFGATLLRWLSASTAMLGFPDSPTQSDGALRGELRLEVRLLVDEADEDAARSLEQVAYLWHADLVDDFARPATLPDEPGTPQDGKLLGQVGRLDVDLVEQFVNSVLAFADELEDPDPRRMSQGPEEFGLGHI